MKTDEKQMNDDEKLTHITETINNLTALMMDENNIPKSSPTQKDKLTTTDLTTVVPTYRRAPPSEGGNSNKFCSMWTLKYAIRSPKFYELLIKTKLKGDTAMGLKKFFNHINMCLNTINILREYLLHYC